MKTTPLIAVLSLMFILSGCDKYENGPELTEPAEIYDTCFVPAGHGETSGGVGINTKGHWAYNFPQGVEIPAAYAVVFKCQHGKFVIDGERGEAIYKSFSKGDLVTVIYQEKLLVHDDGKKEVLGLHLLRAVKRGTSP
jgi:hypothetical protein